MFLQHTNMNLFLTVAYFKILLIPSISLYLRLSPLPILSCKVFKYVEKNPLFIH